MAEADAHVSESGESMALSVAVGHRVLERAMLAPDRGVLSMSSPSGARVLRA